MGYTGRVVKGKLENEGKTKQVFANAFDPDTVIIKFKSDITASDGEKREVITGKDEIDCRTNDHFFQLFNALRIRTHYICKLNKTEFLAKRLVRKAPFEVVTRSIGTGSFLDRNPDVEEGHHFKDLFTEIFYKDDFFNDPMLDASFIKVKDKKGYFAAMIEENERAFRDTDTILIKLGYKLVDWKQEYGWPVGSVEPLVANDLMMIDETTAGNVRIWPIIAEKFDPSKDNLMDQLNRKGMIDKQLFREGKGLAEVKNAFEALALLSGRFPEFYPRKVV